MGGLDFCGLTGSGRQWCSSMIRMISGIGIPSSHRRIGMILSFQLSGGFDEG
jgi:hypothetical protein